MASPSCGCQKRQRTSGLARRRPSGQNRRRFGRDANHFALTFAHPSAPDKMAKTDMAIGRGTQRHPVHSARVGRPRALHGAGRDPEPTGQGARGRRPCQQVSRGARARGRRGRRRPSDRLRRRQPAGPVACDLAEWRRRDLPLRASRHGSADGGSRARRRGWRGSERRRDDPRRGQQGGRRRDARGRQADPGGEPAARGHRAALHPEGGGRAPGSQGVRRVAAARRARDSSSIREHPSAKSFSARRMRVRSRW